MSIPRLHDCRSARVLLLGLIMLSRSLILPVAVVSGGLLTAATDGLIPSALAEDGGGGHGGGGSGGGSGSGHGGGDSSGHGSGDDGSEGSDDGGGMGLSGTAGNGLATDSGGRAGFESDEVVVVADRPDILPIARQLGFSLIENRPFAALGISVLRLRTPVYVGPKQALSRLQRLFPGTPADVNTLYAPYEKQSANVLSLPAPDYARRMIGWSGEEGCGNGFRIGMIDTGVAANLPSLAGRKLHQQSFISDATVPAEPEHGTAIAALLVGLPDPANPEFGGLLPSAEIYAAGVFEKRGQQTAASATSIAAALDWMVSHRVPVVNISLSGDANALVNLAVSRAVASGTTLIAAAGNGGPSAPPAYPGALSDVIAVTAVDQNEAIFPQANRGDYIAFAAPGVGIWTPTMDTIGQYHTGTSFATPFVAAAAAIELMTGAPPEPRELRRRLAGYALHLGAAGHNPIYGHGLIRAAKSCVSITSTH
ncbi:MAG: hypothetical protein QOK29_1025 [Rhodospirillaceae bacterium]|nr:hypothetical protein [Rhodospirillaceae bacterium]